MLLVLAAWCHSFLCAVKVSKLEVDGAVLLCKFNSALSNKSWFPCCVAESCCSKVTSSAVCQFIYKYYWCHQFIKFIISCTLFTYKQAENLRKLVRQCLRCFGGELIRTARRFPSTQLTLLIWCYPPSMVSLCCLLLFLCSQRGALYLLVCNLWLPRQLLMH